MNCEELDELLSAFVDGEATAGERGLVSRHVADCRACADKLRLMSGLKASVKKISAPPAPAALKAALRREAAKRHRPFWAGFFQRTSVRLGLATAFAAAAVLLVVRARTRDEDVPVDALLAEHNQYALTMPLSPSESLYAGLADRIAQGDAHDL